VAKAVAILASLAVGAGCQRPAEPPVAPVAEPVATATSEQTESTRVEAVSAPVRKTVDLDREALLRDLKQRSGTIAVELAATRSLPIAGEFEVAVLNRAEMREFVKRALYLHTTPEELRRMGRVHGSLGMLPRDVETEDALLDLYESGLMGVYDPDTDTLMIGGYVARDMLEEVLGHEIAHAVQDMHFDLASMQVSRPGRSDEDLARTFLMEGDAHASYLAWESGRDPEQFSDRQLDMYADQALELAAQLPYPVLARQLQMPYTEATNVMLRFVRATSWSKINKLYERPPASTEQMLHVHKLLADERPRSMRARAERLKSRWPDHISVVEDTLGEAALLSMLADVTGADQARLGARGWDGDRFVALEHAPGAVPVVAGVIAWDTVADAQEFEPMFREYLRKRVPGEHRLQRKQDVVAFVTGERVEAGDEATVPRAVWNTFVIGERKQGRPR
jgi:hypothetical protein